MKYFILAIYVISVIFHCIKMKRERPWETMGIIFPLAAIWPIGLVYVIYLRAFKNKCYKCLQWEKCTSRKYKQENCFENIEE